ncbi:hypothetical protein L6452_02174 [Arctium lappa]|uniref:Uncharacterized protein n=1 Tax=Arctium lappa TaxID=4217 RepID=A0ACB9FIV9_ARCLA|nr:hypothetical protein L6452_02174 [Arctium lappa]
MDPFSLQEKNLTNLVQGYAIYFHRFNWIQASSSDDLPDLVFVLFSDIVRSVTDIERQCSLSCQGRGDCHAQSLVLTSLHNKVDSFPKISTSSMSREFEADFGDDLFPGSERECLNRLNRIVETISQDVSVAKSDIGQLLELLCSATKGDKSGPSWLSSSGRKKKNDKEEETARHIKEDQYSGKADMRDPMDAQKSQMGKEEKSKEEKDEIKMARIKCYHESVIGRYIPSNISSIQINGLKTFFEYPENILLKLNNANGTNRVEKLLWLLTYELSEWAEMMYFIRREKADIEIW